MDDERRGKERSLMKALQLKYLRALRTNPILTKSVTSAVLSFSGNLTGQLIDIHRGMANEISLPPALRFAAFGFFITGPLMHYFYGFLVKTFPGKGKETMIKRLLFERLVLTPVFALIFHSAMAAMEHRSWDAIKLRLLAVYWLTLTMNWKYYTVAQIINFRFVPNEMKVLYGNFCGFLWTIALTFMKPKTD